MEDESIFTVFPAPNTEMPKENSNNIKIPLELEESGAFHGADTTFFSSVNIGTFAPGYQPSIQCCSPSSVCSSKRRIMGVTSLSQLGEKTLGFYVDIFSYDEENEATAIASSTPVSITCHTSQDSTHSRIWLGSYKWLRIHVSKSLRKSTPIKEEVLKALQNNLQKKMHSTQPEIFSTYGIPRIDAKSIIDRAAGCLDKSVDGGIARKLIRTATLPGNVVWSSYRRKHTLRESDIDYNLHFNQYRMIQLVSDAFRGAAGDGRCILSRLIPPDQSYIVGDLLIRELRIDYIKEVPMDMDAVEVHLFVASKEDEAIIEKYSKEHTLQHRITVHFVCRAYPTYDSLEGVYPASVGTLKVAV